MGGSKHVALCKRKDPSEQFENSMFRGGGRSFGSLGWGWGEAGTGGRSKLGERLLVSGGAYLAEWGNVIKG